MNFYRLRCPILLPPASDVHAYGPAAATDRVTGAATASGASRPGPALAELDPMRLAHCGMRVVPPEPYHSCVPEGGRR